MDYKDAYAKSLQLLNIRFLSEGELRKKLACKDATEAVIDQVVAMLKEEHFLDDDRLARAVYQYYVKKDQYGHAYIAGRLRRRQLPIPEDIERPDECAVAARLIHRKFGDKEVDPHKIARYLGYRGFATSVIREMLDWNS